MTLDLTSPPGPQTETRRPSLTGERRHLTVLFCDLVNSTSVAAQLDPEEWREIVAGYHHAAAEAINRYGGYVAHYLGDGVIAYFGWPEAYDNNAERAARAGLAILDAISKLNEYPKRPKLSARVGIDSGAVVVGVSAGKNADVFGDTPNIAARVQAAALPGTVVVTGDTHRLISGLFVVEERGTQTLKGIERPTRLYRIIRPSGARGHLQAAAAAGALTPFVGRDDELRLLMTRWERTLEGQGQIVLISGEAGIGKSRLMQRFHEQIAGRSYNWVEAAAGPFFQNTPFYPVGDIIRQLPMQHGTQAGRVKVATLHQRNQGRTSLSTFRRSSGHAANRASTKTEEQDEKLQASLELDFTEKLDITPQLAALQEFIVVHDPHFAFLNLLAEAEHPLSPHERRQMLSTLVEWVLSAANVVPLVIAIEDLHWADPSTLELIELLVEHGARAPLLLLCTARPEFRATWQRRTEITLSTLSAHHTRMMVEQVAGQKDLPEELITTVVERTGGVPLFVEELTRSVLESGALKLAAQIPVTLHDSLMARLDRLGTAKEVLQIGAVIGNDFSYELLQAVHPITEQDLQDALQSAADAELVYIHGIAPDATYQFKHALIRDAAYEALLKSRRKELHRLVARTIEEQFPQMREAHPEVLARHWTEAGDADAAIIEWSRAGKEAEARSAFKEALENYQRALALLVLLPESTERYLRELDQRLLIVQMLWITHGYTAAETIEATDSAAALAEKSGNIGHVVKWMIARSVSAYVSGDLSAAAAALLDHTLELAIRENSAISLMSAYSLQVETRYSRGDLAGVEKYFTAGLQLFKTAAPERPSIEAAISAFGTASLNAWVLGRARLARERIAQMIAVPTSNHPQLGALRAEYEAKLHFFLRDYAEAECIAIRAFEVSAKCQLPYYTALSKCLLGHAQAQQGRVAHGIGLLREGIDALLAIGSRLSMGHGTTWLAAALELEGAITESLETIDQAFHMSADEVVHHPEMLRVRGELRLKLGERELAETDFRDSVALAQRIHARSWELRGTMSLARLLASLGRRAEAQAMLATIYNWFTEGFDTADLKEATALLDELSQEPVRAKVAR